MRLMWDEIDANYIQRAHNEQGQFVAHIAGVGWPRSAFISARWCGNPRGVLLRDLHSWEAARAAVERYVADYLAETQ